MSGCAGIDLGARRETSQSSTIICKDKREPKHHHQSCLGLFSENGIAFVWNIWYLSKNSFITKWYQLLSINTSKTLQFIKFLGRHQIAVALGWNL